MLQASTKCVCAKTKAVHDSLRHLEAIFLQSQDIHVKDITTAQDHVRNMLRSVTSSFNFWVAEKIRKRLPVIADSVD